MDLEVLTPRLNSFLLAIKATRRNDHWWTIVRLLSAITFADKFTNKNLECVVFGDDPLLSALVCYFGIENGDVLMVPSKYELTKDQESTHLILRDIIGGTLLDVLPSDLSQAYLQHGLESVTDMLSHKAKQYGNKILKPVNYSLKSADVDFRGNINSHLYFLKERPNVKLPSGTINNVSGHAIQGRAVHMLSSNKCFIVAPCDTQHMPLKNEGAVDCNISSLTGEKFGGDITFYEMREMQLKAVINEFK